jgi:hypothetical protein
VTGFLTTRAITGQAITAAATSARESRLWDKRAAAYEAALSELAQRRVRRQRAIDHLNEPSAEVDFVAEYFATRDTAGRHGAGAGCWLTPRRRSRLSFKPREMRSLGAGG